MKDPSWYNFNAQRSWTNASEHGGEDRDRDIGSRLVSTTQKDLINNGKNPLPSRSGCLLASLLYRARKLTCVINSNQIRVGSNRPIEDGPVVDLERSLVSTLAYEGLLHRG